MHTCLDSGTRPSAALLSPRLQTMSIMKFNKPKLK